MLLHRNLVSGHRNIIVSCIYRCPGCEAGSNTDIFSEHIVQLFVELTMRKTVFLCGDFKIDILKHKVNQGTKSFLDTMYSIGLYPLVGRPTRISNHSFSLIDNIFTNVTNHTVAYDLVLAVRKRRLRYLGHVLRLPADRMVRRALLAHVMGCRQYPAGSLFSDCADVSLPQLVTMASDRAMWRAKVVSLS